MKIRLTKRELLSVLTKHFGMEVTEYVIQKEPSTAKLSVKIINALGKTGSLTHGGLSVPSDKKIMAIKTLREFVGVNTIGLAEAKWAIENWTQWISFVKKENRIPVLTNRPLGFTIS